MYILDFLYSIPIFHKLYIQTNEVEKKAASGYYISLKKDIMKLARKLQKLKGTLFIKFS